MDVADGNLFWIGGAVVALLILILVLVRYCRGSCRPQERKYARHTHGNAPQGGRHPSSAHGGRRRQPKTKSGRIPKKYPVHDGDYPRFVETVPSVSVSTLGGDDGDIETPWKKHKGRNIEKRNEEVRGPTRGRSTSGPVDVDGVSTSDGGFVERGSFSQRFVGSSGVFDDDFEKHMIENRPPSEKSTGSIDSIDDGFSESILPWRKNIGQQDPGGPGRNTPVTSSPKPHMDRMTVDEVMAQAEAARFGANYGRGVRLQEKRPSPPNRLSSQDGAPNGRPGRSSPQLQHQLQPRRGPPLQAGHHSADTEVAVHMSSPSGCDTPVTFVPAVPQRRDSYDSQASFGGSQSTMPRTSSLPLTNPNPNLSPPVQSQHVRTKSPFGEDPFGSNGTRWVGNTDFDQMSNPSGIISPNTKSLMDSMTESESSEPELREKSFEQQERKMIGPKSRKHMILDYDNNGAAPQPEFQANFEDENFDRIQRHSIRSSSPRYDPGYGAFHAPPPKTSHQGSPPTRYDSNGSPPRVDRNRSVTPSPPHDDHDLPPPPPPEESPRPVSPPAAIPSRPSPAPPPPPPPPPLPPAYDEPSEQRSLPRNTSFTMKDLEELDKLARGSGDSVGGHSSSNRSSSRRRRARQPADQSAGPPRNGGYDTSDDEHDANNRWLASQVEQTIGPRSSTADVESIGGRSGRSRGTGSAPGSRSGSRVRRRGTQSRRRSGTGGDGSVGSRDSKGSRGSRGSRMSTMSHRSAMSVASRSVADDLLRLETQLALVGASSRNPSPLSSPDNGNGVRGGGGSVTSAGRRSVNSAVELRPEAEGGSQSQTPRRPGRGGVPSPSSVGRDDKIKAKRYRFNVKAPPGKLGVILANRPKERGGTVVTEVRKNSPLYGRILPGSRIVAVDGEDVARMTVSEITTIMSRKSERDRLLTIVTDSARVTAGVSSPESLGKYDSGGAGSNPGSFTGSNYSGAPP